jgi:hypothetical protein
MSEVKKLTAEELQSVISIREQYTNIVVALGEIEIEKAELLENQRALKQKELAIAKELTVKYGEGTIDIETGEFK